jgi:phosphoenolpyruvate carboxykinase (ATP)
MSKLEAKDLEQYGLKDVKEVKYNSSYDELTADEKSKNECTFTDNNTAMVDTGIFTGRSPKDKYFVEQEPSCEYINWGKINQPVSKEIYEDLFKTTTEQLSGKELYVVDAFAGASKSSRKAIRFITEIAWQAHFMIQKIFLFLKHHPSYQKP